MLARRDCWLLALLVGCIAAVVADEFASVMVDEDNNLVLVAPAEGEKNCVCCSSEHILWYSCEVTLLEMEHDHVCVQPVYQACTIECTHPRELANKTYCTALLAGPCVICRYISLPLSPPPLSPTCFTFGLLPFHLSCPFFSQNQLVGRCCNTYTCARICMCSVCVACYVVVGAVK